LYYSIGIPHNVIVEAMKDRKWVTTSKEKTIKMRMRPLPPMLTSIATGGRKRGHSRAKAEATTKDTNTSL